MFILDQDRAGCDPLSRSFVTSGAAANATAASASNLRVAEPPPAHERSPYEPRRGAGPSTQCAVDRELVRRVQRGERGAFDLLVAKYQHRIAHLIWRYVRNPSEVEDVTQEAFVKAYRGLASFRGDSAFYTWLYRIAINTAKNHRTSVSRRVPNQGIEAAEAERYDEGALLRDTDTPERQVMKSEIERAVDRAIGALPAELREAVTLREMEGLSYEDIASVMACPIGTVRSRIFRAREAIDQAIAPLIYETDP